MKKKITAISLVVRDYDEAIAFYRGILDFKLIEDSPLEDGKRWVVMAPPGAKETRLLLAKAKDEAQQARVGDQTGGRVFLFLETDDFWRDYWKMKSEGVVFCEEPREEPYGQVVVFKDLYGNKWDLIQRR